MLKAKELMSKTIDELEASNIDLCKEIFQLNNELRASRKLEKPHLLREKKKDRARILTVLRQKKNQEAS